MKACPRSSRPVVPLGPVPTAALLALSLALPVSCGLGTEGLPSPGTGGGKHTSSSSGSGQGGDIFSGSSSATSGVGGSSSSTTGSSSGSSGAGGSTAVVWHSWDAKSSPSELFVLDEKGMYKATIIPYQSNGLMDLSVDKQLTTFTMGNHQDTSNNVMDYWTDQSLGQYPYVGKSNVPRGMDSGEAPAPDPLGVYDLQLFPQATSKLIVARFMVPIMGNYELSDLAARRVYSSGDNTTFQAYAADMNMMDMAVGPALNAKKSQKWVTDGNNKHSLGLRMPGDLINFTVDANGNSMDDATEIAWTITAK